MSELMGYLPENYRGSREVLALQNALQGEVDGVWAARDDLLAQLDPYTATWGLELWERALGIESAAHLDTQLRRRQIAATVQSQTETTPAAVQEAARTFLGMDAAVEEVFQEYRIELDVPAEYVPGAGLPRLMDHLARVLPAHIAFHVTTHMEGHASKSFLRCGNVTTFCGARGLPTESGIQPLTWAQLDALGWSWADWGTKTWFKLLYGR